MPPSGPAGGRRARLPPAGHIQRLGGPGPTRGPTGCRVTRAGRLPARGLRAPLREVPTSAQRARFRYLCPQHFLHLHGLASQRGQRVPWTHPIRCRLPGPSATGQAQKLPAGVKSCSPRLGGALLFETCKPERPSCERPGVADCVTAPQSPETLLICQAQGPIVGAPDQVSPAFCVPRKLAVSLGPLPALICMQGPCPVDWIRTRGASGSDSQSWGPGGRAGTLPSPLCPTSSCPGGADTAALPPSSAPGPPGTCSPISAGVLGRGTRDPGTAASPGVVRTGRLGLGLWAGPRGPSQSRGEGTALGAPAGPRGVVPWKSLLSLCVITLARVLHGASTQATSAGLDAPFPWQREGPRAGERRQPPRRVGKSRVGPPARSTGRRGPGRRAADPHGVGHSPPSWWTGLWRGQGPGRGLPVGGPGLHISLLGPLPSWRPLQPAWPWAVAGLGR